MLSLLLYFSFLPSRDGPKSALPANIPKISRCSLMRCLIASILVTIFKHRFSLK